MYFSDEYLHGDNIPWNTGLIIFQISPDGLLFSTLFVLRTVLRTLLALLIQSVAEIDCLSTGIAGTSRQLISLCR